MLIFIIILLIFLCCVVFFILLIKQSPDVARLAAKNPEESAFMRFRDRQSGSAPGRRRQTWTELSRISPYLIQSVIVAEDRNFLTHKGYYWEEMWVAMLTNVRRRRIIKGGSSITQQLAKNLYLSPSRSIFRKLVEAFITYKLENSLTKARILELYLNVIEWGDNIYGAEEASINYYHKSANELTLTEAIHLAAAIPSPRSVTPLDRNNIFLLTRVKRISTSLLRDGWISQAKYNQTLIELGELQEPGSGSAEFTPFQGLSDPFSTPEFWISSLEYPDVEIMDVEEINIFNRRSSLLSGEMDIFSFPEYMSCEEIKDKVLEVAGVNPSAGAGALLGGNPAGLESFARVLFDNGTPRFGKDNEPLNGKVYAKVLTDMNVSGLNENIKVRYALTVHRTDLLLWPSDEIVMNKRFDYEFNRLHQSSFGIAEPVAVVHQSEDGSWSFVRTGSLDGWVRTNDVAFSAREEVSAYPGGSFLVVTSANCRTGTGAEVRLGTKLRLIAREEGDCLIELPVRGVSGELQYLKDTIPAADVNEGYLKYTRSNSITAAFELLGSPYGWGGAGGGTDCSSYLQYVFNVFGIFLPRNSSAQAMVGRRISRFHGPDIFVHKKHKRARNWVPGITMLRFPGHIMLYLGEYDGKHYAIHSIWGVTNNESKVWHINRVAVTDLDLGLGSPNGSLFERITDVASLDLEKPGFMGLIRDFNYALSLHPWRIPILFVLTFVFSIVLVILIKLL